MKIFKVALVWALLLVPELALAQSYPNSQFLGYGKPQDSNVAVLTTATAVGTPSNYHYLIVENEGTAGICGSFATNAITAPANGLCATGFYLAAGGALTLTASFGMLPNTQLYVIAAAAGTNTVWLSAQ